MSITLRQAKPLCTAEEYELVRQSTGHTPNLTAARAKQLITLSRRLRDKYRALAERQRREARGKQKPQGSKPAAGNDRTQVKVQLFGETLERFEQKLQQVGSGELQTRGKKKAGKKTQKRTARSQAKEQAATEAPAPDETKPRKVGKKVGTSKAPKKKATAAKTATTGSVSLQPRVQSRKTKSRSAQVGAEKSRQAATPLQKIRGHVSAAGRRNQARRDRR